MWGGGNIKTYETNEEAAAAYQVGNEREKYEAAIDLFVKNANVTEFVSRDFADTVDSEKMREIAWLCIQRAAEKYIPEHGSFYNFYWTIYKRDLTSHGPRKMRRKFGDRVKDWPTFLKKREAAEEKNKNIFDHLVILNDCPYISDEFNKLTKTQKDYIAMMLHINVTDKIAMRALDIPRSSFYYMKKNLQKLLEPALKHYKSMVGYAGIQTNIFALLAADDFAPAGSGGLQYGRGLSIEMPGRYDKRKENDDAEKFIETHDKRMVELLAYLLNLFCKK